MISQGSGSQNEPFVVIVPSNLPEAMPSIHLMALVPGYSAQMQNATIDGIYGKSAWSMIGRDYFESQIAPPGNRDLCRWSIETSGHKVYVWFDLSNVSLIMNEPHLLAKNPKV